MYKCPNCGEEFDINDSFSYHQVNDNNEKTYCSYVCSAQGTLEFIRKGIEDGSIEHVHEVAEAIGNT